MQFIVLTSIFTLLGGFFAIKFSRYSYILSSFSAGAVIGLAFFDLIPESVELNNIHSTLLCCVIGFVIYFIINNFLSFDSNDSCTNRSHNFNANSIGLCLHSIGDGLAIGLVSKAMPILAPALILAIISHDFADGINISTISKNNHQIRWIIINALSPFIGYFISLFLNPDKIIMGNILGIIGGICIYIATIHLIPECHKSNNKIVVCAAFVIGIILMRMIN